MNDIMNTLVQYLLDTLNVSATVCEWVKHKHLPQYLRGMYRFYSLNFLDRQIVLVVDTAEKEQAVSTISKHLAKVRSYSNAEIVYVRYAVTSYNRTRLIKHGIPFIVPGNQMYLPMLGIDLREHHKRMKKKREVFTPSTQVLVLYSLLNEDYGVFTPGVMSTHLGYSAMTMTRSFDQLEAAGIGQHSREGKVRHLKLVPGGRQLWENILSYLSSPVESFVYTLPGKGIREGKIAGESALANFTMQSEPENPVIALGSRRWKSIKQMHDIQILNFAEPGALMVEIWKYPPDKLTKSGIVDPLSLYLSLMEIQDERVQSSLYQLMREMRW